MIKRAVRLLIVALLLALGTGPLANAQSRVALTPGATLTLDGLQFTVATCSVDNGGTRGHTCGTSDRLFLAPTTGPGASVIIEALNTSNVAVPIFSYACGATGACPGGNYDLGFTLDVQALGTATINDVTQTLVGSATPSSLRTGQPGDVHAAETVLSASNANLCGISTNLASLSAVCPTFASQTYLQVTKNLGLSLSGVTNGSTLTLTSIAESFTPAPEPASLASLLAGLFALGAVRRRSRTLR